MTTETEMALLPVASSGSEHLAVPLLLEQAQSAIAFERERADTAERELAAFADGTGELVASAGEALRERAEAAEAEVTRLRALLGEHGQAPEPLVPEGEYMTPAEARAVLRIEGPGLRYLEGKGRLTSVKTLGGHRRYLTASVGALRAELDAARVPPEGLLTFTAAAAMLHVAPGTVTRWVNAGKIVPVKIPGRRRGLRPQDVRALLRGDGAGP